MTNSQVAPFLNARSAAPVFLAADLDAALERYHKLGFGTSRDSTQGPVSGFISFGPGTIHIAQAEELDPGNNTSCCFLYVQDADAVYALWSVAPVAGRLYPPADQPYGLREFAYIDPDGNLMRVGSHLPAQTEA